MNVMGLEGTSCKRSVACKEKHPYRMGLNETELAAEFSRWILYSNCPRSTKTVLKVRGLFQDDRRM